MTRWRVLGLAGAVLAIGLLTGAILPDDPALLEAIKQGDVAAVRSLLQEGADPNAAQGDGLSALHLAAQEGSLDIAELLLSAWAEVDAKTKIGDYTPLQVAAGAARLSVVQVGQSVVDMTRGGRNGFFSRMPYPKTMELLLGLGSEFRCMNTHMRNNGDWCPGAGVAPFKDAVQAEGQVVKPTTR